MKAAVLNAFGAPLSVQTLPDPVLGSGEIIVDVVAAGIAGYTAGVFSGARWPWMKLNTPAAARAPSGTLM